MEEENISIQKNDNHKKHKKYGRYILLILTILWMAIIFAHSAKTADESTEASHRVGMWIGQMVVPGFEEWSSTKQMEFAARIDHPVRKTAHATEYAILGILVLLTLLAWKEDAQKNIRYPGWKLSWVIATFYACTDEFHQLFVPGRSGQITDICIDSLGAFAGVMVVWLLYRWSHRRKSRSKWRCDIWDF